MPVFRGLAPALSLALAVSAFLTSTATAEPADLVASSVPVDRPDSSLRVTDRDGDEDLLAAPRRGERAIKALGKDLRTAARKNNLSSARLTKLLRTDDTAWVSTSGRLFYVDQVSYDDPEVAASIPPPQYPTAETFSKHSRPTSTRKIYLDFDGVTLVSGGEGNAWLPQGFSAGTKKGFSLDATYGVYTATEHGYIQHVYRMIAEKFAAFDVDVTTQDPGVGGYSRSTVSETSYGTHLVFSDSVDAGSKPPALCPEGCGGIAYVGVFDALDSAGQFDPAWVYTSVFNDDPSSAANAAAHEVGHTLGLDHDGTSTLAYYSGHANWFPMMGSSFNAVGQWSKGEYADANQLQDDLVVMESFGAPRMADDWGDLGSPTAVGTPASYSASGVIEDDTDTDVFSLTTACTANLVAEASGIGEGQSLDIKVTIRNAAGEALTSNNPASGQTTNTFPFLPTGLDASASVANAPAGDYLVEVEGVGAGDPLSTGYSGYGSIGQYQLLIGGCATPGGAAPSVPLTLTKSLPDRSTTATIAWAAPSSAGTPSTITGYRISGIPAGTQDISASSRSFSVTGLVPGSSYAVKVAAINATGVGPAATLPITVKTWIPSTAPNFVLKVVRNELQVDFIEPANPGNAAFTTWRLTIGRSTFDTDYSRYPGINVTGFRNGSYTAALVLYGDADLGSVTPAVTRSFRVGASAPRIGIASSGTAGRPVTATARWAAPLALGGYRITGYRVIAYKLNSRGAIVRSFRTAMLSPGARSFTVRPLAGRYKFRVVAYNAIGASPSSAFSRIVTAR